MTRFAMLCAALALAACSTRDENATVGDSAGGMMAPGTAGAAGDSSAMSGTSGTGGTAGVSGSANASGTAGTTGGTGGTAGTSGTTGASGTAAAGAQNQTQSGVTNAKTGASTLGPNIKKVEPTQGAAVTRKGQTLKPGGDSVKTPPPR